MRYFIYMIEGPHGRRYIGKTCKSADQRFREHVRHADKGENTALYQAIRKHGANAFVVSTITECVSNVEAKVCERALIAQYGTLRGDAGYNLTIGGDGNSGWKPSEETKALWRKQRAGRYVSPEWRASLSRVRKGKKKPPVTAETRAKLSRSIKGRKLTPEWIAKVAAAGIGRRHSAESIAKMRLVQSARVRPEGEAERLRALAAARKGKPRFAWNFFHGRVFYRAEREGRAA